MKGLCICGVYETVNCRIWFGNDLLSYYHAISAKIILYEGQKQKQLFFVLRYFHTLSPFTLSACCVVLTWLMNNLSNQVTDDVEEWLIKETSQVKIEKVSDDFISWLDAPLDTTIWPATWFLLHSKEELARFTIQNEAVTD